MNLKNLKLKLLDPYDFEGTKVTELDLSGLSRLTALDMCQISDKMNEKGYSGQMMELTVPYAILITTKAMEKPWEYCDKLSARDTIRLKNFISNFLYSRASIDLDPGAASQEET